jgi:hypothetical protein
MHIPKNILDECKKTITNFIWNGKPPKVKYSTLINTIEEGGLKLQDIESKLKAIKLKWIKSINDENFKAPWKSYLSSKIHENINQLPRYNYSKQDYPTLKHQFYNELFAFWAMIHTSTPKNADEICIQTLWHNTHIRVDGRTLNYKSWQTANINYVQDIIDHKGNILDKKQLNQKYNIACKYLEYESLFSAINPIWKKQLKEKACFNTNYIISKECKVYINNTEQNINENDTRDVYWYLIQTISKRPTSETKWLEKVNFIIDEPMWKIIYTNNKYITKDTDILNFQFKITHRLLACNYNLKIWKVKNNDGCDHCQCVDTIEHFLVQCETTKSFWQQVFNWWAQNVRVWLHIDTYEVLFGIPNELNDAIINQLNFLILYGKYYVYKCKKKDNTPQLHEYLIECKKQMMLKIENETNAGTLDKFQKQWNELYESLGF